MLVVVRDLIPGLFLPCIVSLQCFVKQLVINLLQILIDKYNILCRPLSVYIGRCKLSIVMPDTAPAGHAGSGILADCYTYNTFVSHTYNKSKDKTYFICNYGWEWDKCPNWVLTDCAGLGWNHDFHPDDAVDSDYNKTFKTYVNQGNASDKKYTTKHIYEKELQTAEDQFDMNGFYGSDYYVKSGSGTICLSQTGKVNDVKLSFKYGHNQFGPAVSVSYPWGVSFGLDGAETIFQPDEIVYNDFATVK